MTDITPEVARVREQLGAQPPKATNTAQVDRAVLRSYGLAEVADRIWRDATEVSDTARADVTRRVRSEHGARSPRGGLISILVRILTFTGAIPIGFLNAIRLGSPEGLQIGAVLTAALGIVAVGLATATRLRPVAASTAFQSKIFALLILIASAIGVTIADDIVQTLLFIAGAAGALIAAVLYSIGRARDRSATAHIDEAEARARTEVAPSVDAERERMRARLAGALSGRADVDAIRSTRSLVIAALRQEGSAAEDTAPTSLPGEYIIRTNTNRWLPLSEQGVWPPQDPLTPGRISLVSPAPPER
ncbi:MAG: hypothetical protein ACQEW8_05995 [Actinomycetota bacterium]